MHLMSYFLHVFTIMTVFGPPREMLTVVCSVSNVLFLSDEDDYCAGGGCSPADYH